MGYTNNYVLWGHSGRLVIWSIWSVWSFRRLVCLVISSFGLFGLFRLFGLFGLFGASCGNQRDVPPEMFGAVHAFMHFVPPEADCFVCLVRYLDKQITKNDS